MQLKSLFSKCTIVYSAALMGVTLIPTDANAQPFAYVANYGSNSVSVINTATNGIVATVPVGINPDALAVTPDRARVYVVNQTACRDFFQCEFQFPPPPSNVSVIDTATNAVIATVTVGHFPIGIAITPDGTRAYVTNHGDGSVSVINTATNLVAATITGLSGPTGIAITPDGTRAYAIGSRSSVTVIDISTNTIKGSLTLPLANLSAATNAIAITPDGTRAYVTAYCFPYTDTQDECTDSLSYVSVIATATTTDIKDIRVDPGIWGVVISPDGTRAYVANGYTNSVLVLDTANNSPIATITLGPHLLGGEEYGIAITPDGTRVYVTNLEAGVVQVINTATNTIATTIGVGFGPVAVAIGGPTPTILLTALKAQFQAGNLPDIGHSFSDQIQVILNDIAGNNGMACTDLQDFVNHIKAQTGKRFTADQITAIMNSVLQAAAQLHCTI
jgi:YVTN family beta-propeller protein